jgi:tripartite-type tricarboxylate transporter receptor subunit TctC
MQHVMKAMQKVSICLLAVLAQAGYAATAKPDFPTKPIRIVTSEVGGGLDFVARLVSTALSPVLGQQVIVDNRPSGVFTGSIVSKATPDGYTLLFNGSSFWMLPFLQANVPYDPIRDFAPITLATNAPLLLVVHPGLPAKSVQELIALAKAQPGKLNYSSSSLGTPQHIAAEQFKSMAGLDIVRIPYKGAGPAMVALAAGEVQMTFSSAGAAMPHIKAGRARASAGLPGFEAGSLWGFFGPARTPPALVNRLRDEIVAVLNKPDVKEKLHFANTEVVGSTPQKFAEVIKADMARGAKVIKAAGIKAD